MLNMFKCILGIRLGGEEGFNLLFQGGQVSQTKT